MRVQPQPRRRHILAMRLQHPLQQEMAGQRQAGGDVVGRRVRRSGEPSRNAGSANSRVGIDAAPRRATPRGRSWARHRSDRRSRRWRRIRERSRPKPSASSSPASQRTYSGSPVARHRCAIIASSRISPASNTGACASRSGSAAPATAVKALRPGQRVAAVHQVAGAGAGQFAGEAAQMFFQPGPPVHMHAVARLQRRLDPPRGAAAHQPGMAAMLAGQQLRGWRRFRHGRGRTARWRRRSIPWLFVREIQADFLVVLAVLGPVLAHLHEQEQMHAAAEQCLPVPRAPVRRSS